MPDLPKLNKIDPLKRRVEKQTGKEEFSPMDPPDAYAPPNNEKIPYEEMHSFLRALVDEHKDFINQLDVFEEALNDILQNGISRQVDEKLKEFFRFFDDHIVKHNQKEEKVLFPLLHRRLMAAGEHSLGPEPTTGVDMLEDDHSKALQLAAITFNFFGLAARLPDLASRLIVLDSALEQAKALIELLRLHIFREDNMVFGMAHKYIAKEEFDEMQKL